MAYGPNSMRMGTVRVDQPTGGVAASAITVTGTVRPAGMTVETAWGANPQQPPLTGWGAATAVSGTMGGSWTRTTVRPAAGTWFLHARIVQRPRVDIASASIVVT